MFLVVIGSQSNEGRSLKAVGSRDCGPSTGRKARSRVLTVTVTTEPWTAASQEGQRDKDSAAFTAKPRQTPRATAPLGRALRFSRKDLIVCFAVMGCDPPPAGP